MTSRSSFGKFGVRRAARVAFALGCVLAAGASGCTCGKGKKTEEARKDEKPTKKAPLGEVAPPDGLLAELDLKDPDAFVKRAADGAGFGKEVGASPYEKLVAEAKDENAKKALKAIDPHGALVVIALGDVAKAIKEDKADENFHGIGAAKLKDAEMASTALSAASKAGKFDSKTSKTLDGPIYVSPGGKKGAIAIIGDEIVVADEQEVIEIAGKYVASRAMHAEKQEHDLEGRVVSDRLTKPSIQWFDGQWAKFKTEIPGKAQVEADKVVDGVLAGLGDAGDVTFTADVKGDDVFFQQKVVAKGSLSKWLAKYPTVDAKSLLSMPKGQGAAVFGAPDGLGPLVYEGIDEGMKSGKVPAADAADISKNVRALGGALGHEVSYASAARSPAGGAFASPETEIFARVELTDPKAAKGALAGLGVAAKKPSAGIKAKSVAYKHAGAEGETWTIDEGTKPSTFVYAIKGTYLYLDVCISCTPTLMDGALDGKDTLESDGAAKAKIGSYPTKGLVSATYGDADSYGKLLSAILGPTTMPAPSGSTWGYATASSDAIEGKSGMPLSVVGGIVKAVMMGAMRPGRLGAPGFAPPPPGMGDDE